MTRADGIDILRQRIEKGGTVKIGGCLQQMQLIGHIAYHLGKTRQSLSHATHLTGDVHVPHFITVARTAAALLLRSFFRDEGAIGQTVPHPESHVLGNKQSLGGYFLVIDIVGNVDESSQLLVNGVVRSPHPIFVVVGTVHLNQCAVLGRNGVQVAIAIVTIIFLIAVEGSPCSLQLA